MRIRRWYLAAPETGAEGGAGAGGEEEQSTVGAGGDETGDKASGTEDTDGTGSPGGAADDAGKPESGNQHPHKKPLSSGCKPDEKPQPNDVPPDQSSTWIPLALILLGVLILATGRKSAEASPTPLSAVGGDLKAVPKTEASLLP